LSGSSFEYEAEHKRLAQEWEEHEQEVKRQSQLFHQEAPQTEDKPRNRKRLVFIRFFFATLKALLNYRYCKTFHRKYPTYYHAAAHEDIRKCSKCSKEYCDSLIDFDRSFFSYLSDYRD
jgi:hypothetical protein